jgi:TonB-dependent receptor
MRGSTFRVVLLCSCAALYGGQAWAVDATDSLTEIVVTAPRQEAKAREVQQAAPNLVTVQSAETIAKYPDFNAAESLGRLPGISLSSDTGEGRFINIRGIDGNLDGATFGGVPMLNTYAGGTYFGGGGRAVEYDTVPTGSIDGLVVTYTGLPDHEAEGLGGSVELTPRTAANITKPFIDGTAGWGYEPMHSHDGPSNLDLAVGVRFGFDNGRLIVEGRDPEPDVRTGWVSNPTPFSFVVTGSQSNDRRGFDDLEEDYNNPGTADHSYQDIQLRRYDYHRTRFGGGGEFDFRPNDDHSYYLRANVAGYTEAVSKNRLTYNFAPYTQTPSGTGFNSLADLSIASTDERETHRNDFYVLGGKDRFGEVVLDYRASYSQASYDQDRNYGGTFSGPTGVNVHYDNSANNGDFPTLNVLGGADPNNAALYTLRNNTIGNTQQHDLDREYAYAGNLLFPVHLINDSDRIKVGVEVRLRDKSQNQYSESLNVGAVNLASMSTPAINYYDDHYSNGPQVNINAQRTLAQSVEGPAVFDPSGYFNARENIYAEYAQYQTTVGKWSALAGVRVETTNASYGNYVFDADGNPLGFSRNAKNYTNAFPTVQVRYDFSPTMLVRATYSTGIGRPGFNQVAGAVTVDGNNGVISTGNPNLKPTTGNSFDLSLEYYLPNGGIAQIGAFDKEFTNYVASRVVFGTDPRIPGDLNVQFQTFENIPSAYARGVQASYHQQFIWLPKPLDGLGIESNVTLVDSHMQEYAASGSDQAQYSLLPGTSKVTANVAGFYEAHGVMARLSAQYVSRELFSLGGSQLTDTTQDDRLTLDLATSYKVNSNFTLYFDAKNLTNAPLRFYIGNPSFPIQREFYDVTYEAGVKFHF